MRFPLAGNILFAPPGGENKKVSEEEFKSPPAGPRAGCFYAQTLRPFSHGFSSGAQPIFSQCLSLRSRRVRAKWAGLRSAEKRENSLLCEKQPGWGPAGPELAQSDAGGRPTQR